MDGSNGREFCAKAGQIATRSVRAVSAIGGRSSVLSSRDFDMKPGRPAVASR
jgi:hypothetical protein